MSTDNHIGHVILTCLDTMNYCQVEVDLMILHCGWKISVNVCKSV